MQCKPGVNPTLSELPKHQADDMFPQGPVGTREIFARKPCFEGVERGCNFDKKMGAVVPCARVVGAH